MITHEEYFRRNVERFTGMVERAKAEDSCMLWLWEQCLASAEKRLANHLEELKGTEAELLEGSIGVAYRPVDATWLVVLSKYTKRYEQHPISAGLELPSREETDVVSLTPIFELPFNIQIVEKLALKRLAVQVEQLPTVVSYSLLSINRLNYHLTNTWDAGAEYRFLQSSLGQNLMHGALVELNYIIKKKIRIGLGYNFSSFSDNEFARLDEDHGGPFFRVVGQY